jgi:predicted nucleic acid-binding protein
MANPLTLDASVFVSSVKSDERGAAESLKLLAAIRELGIPMIEPSILLVEISAAIARGTGDESLAINIAGTISRLAPMVMVNLDRRTALSAARLAATHRLRGADAIYAAVADQYGARLVTLDKEQLARSPKSLKPCTPAEILKTL